jgi:signal transduction histidine kinase/CheY-like chemotaxis protein
MTHESPISAMRMSGISMPLRAGQFQALVTLLHEISLHKSLRSVFVVAIDGTRAILGAKWVAVRIFASDTGAQAVTPPTLQFQPNSGSIDALICEIEGMTGPESRPNVQAGQRQPESQGKRSLSCAWIAVPLLNRDDRSIGWIRAWDKPAGPFTAEDETTLALVAQFLSLAIENDRLLESEDDVQAKWQNEIRERKRLEEDLRQVQRIGMVGRLAGGIAHDFNNILTASLGYSELMMRRLDPSHQIYPMAQCIREVSLQARELTRSLLAFSRQHVVEPHVVELNELVSTIANMFVRLMGEDIVLVRDLDPQVQNVRVNPYEIEQALLNLVINACDAMANGGTLTVKTSNIELKHDFFCDGEQAMPGLWSVLEVSDTGCGIGRATMSHIFEPFFTTKPEDRGNGLGLTMVAQTVKKNDGIIRVESKADVGSCFRIYLPSANQLARSISLPPITGRQCLGTETIMVVEDDDKVRRLLYESLTDHGYFILCAEDGLEALRVAKSNPGRINLLLTDLVMLGMNGKTLAEHFNQLGIASRFLFISGRPDRLGALKLTRKFCYSCLAKPFTPGALVTTVREILDRQIDEET